MYKKLIASAGIIAILNVILAAAEPAALSPIGGVGKAESILKDGSEAVLFEHQGKGCLSHFWFGGNFDDFENTRIRYYVDGEETPSIDMNLYMGHGIGFNDSQAPWVTKYIGKIGEQNGIFNNYRIPFGKSVRVTAQRSSKANSNVKIWWIIRGVENGRVNIGGVELPESARLKLYRLENHTAEPLEEFNLCDAPGHGAIFQVFIAAKGLGKKSVTYLEACMRAYLDQAREPVMLSSGLEDYFLGTYYFDTGKYHADIAGLTHFDTATSSFSAYRFHDEDPLFFNKGLRLTCRNSDTPHGAIKGAAGDKNLPKVRFTTYTWVYQW